MYSCAGNSHLRRVTPASYEYEFIRCPHHLQSGALTTSNMTIASSPTHEHPARCCTSRMASCSRKLRTEISSSPPAPGVPMRLISGLRKRARICGVPPATSYDGWASIKDACIRENSFPSSNTTDAGLLQRHGYARRRHERQAAMSASAAAPSKNTKLTSPSGRCSAPLS